MNEWNLYLFLEVITQILQKRNVKTAENGSIRCKNTKWNQMLFIKWYIIHKYKNNNNSNNNNNNYNNLKSMRLNHPSDASLTFKSKAWINI